MVEYLPAYILIDLLLAKLRVQLDCHVRIDFRQIVRDWIPAHYLRDKPFNFLKVSADVTYSITIKFMFIYLCKSYLFYYHSFTFIHLQIPNKPHQKTT